MLEGNGKGDFKVLNDIQSGLHINGEVRDIAEIRLASGNSLFVYALNNDSAVIYGKAGRWSCPTSPADR